MHVYYKYKVYFKNFEEFLNREISCIAITTLADFAACLMATFKTSGKKKYYFNINDQIYECNEGLRLLSSTNIHHNTDVALSRLNTNKFIFIYDYEEKFEFIIEKIDSLSNDTWRKVPTIISGVGYGIIEDNKQLLIDYFQNKISFFDVILKSNNKKLNELDDFIFNDSDIKYYNEYNKIRRNRMEKN